LGLSEDCELSVVLTTDESIAELNRRYLGREGPTNVMAFAMQEGEGAGLHPGLLGDVVVSADRAVAEAPMWGSTAHEHLLRLVIHGLLHLLGHEDATEEGARQMEELTERLLAAAMEGDDGQTLSECGSCGHSSPGQDD